MDIFVLFMAFPVIAFLGLLMVFAIIIMFDYQKYSNSNYKSGSSTSYFKVRTNAGLNGEYLTFRELERLDGYKKILANVYIPKDDKETTEIDLIMIHEKGIFCIESKNYSGWIFGDEKSPYWTQSLQNRKKNKFYNPVMQNATHIKHLAKIMGVENLEEINSVIVFSVRCELKKVNMTSENIVVLKRDELRRKLNNKIKNSKDKFSNKDVDNIFLELSKYANVDQATKEKHIENIKRKTEKSS